MADPVLMEKIDNLTKNVATLNRVLIGNGNTKQCLLVQFTELQASVTGPQGCQARSAESRKRKTALVPWIISTVVAVGAILVAVLK